MNPDRQTEYVPALGFHWLTPLYDLAVRLTTRERRFKSALIEQAVIMPGHQVLDLACGTGTLAIWIKKRYPEAIVTGLDGDPRMLEIARTKAHKAGVDVDFRQGFSTNLPFANHSFDRAMSSLFFHHLNWQDKQITVQELWRVLDPDGELHVADWGKADNLLMRSLFLVIQCLDGFDNTGDNVRGRLIELFEGGGFRTALEQRTFPTVLGTMTLYSARPERAVPEQTADDP